MQQQAPFEEWEIFSIPGDAISSKQLHICRKKVQVEIWKVGAR
jgi:hypothetical protein